MAKKSGPPRRPVGRPSRCTNKVIEDLELALMLGATNRIAALSAGISEDTFYKWKREAEAAIWRLDEQQALLDEYETAKQLAEVNGEAPPPEFKPDFSVSNHERQLLKFIRTIGEAEALGAMQHLQNINNAAPGDPSLSQWMLTNRHGYGREPQKIIHAGDKDNPVTFSDVSDMSIEERAARVALILQAAEKRRSESESEGDQKPADTDDVGV